MIDFHCCYCFMATVSSDILSWLTTSPISRGGLLMLLWKENPTFDVLMLSQHLLPSFLSYPCHGVKSDI